LASAKSGDAPGFVESALPPGEYLRSNVEKCMSGAKKGCLASGTLGKHNVGPFSGVGQDPVQQELIHVRVVPNRMERRRGNSFNLKGSFTEALAAVHSFWESTSLPRFRAPTPCYVVDLQGVSDVQQGILSLPQPSGDTNPPWQVVYWSDESAPENYTGKPMRVETDFPPLHNMDIGTVQELRFNGPPTGENSTNRAYEIGGIRDHPIHIHVAPFQIRKLRCKDGSWVGEPDSPQGCDGSNYFMTGDWHDTLMDSGGQAIVRMQLSDFAGKYVVHCHILAHEDEGMMAYFQVRGEDGTQWPGVHSRSCVKSYSAEHPRYILLDSEGN